MPHLFHEYSDRDPKCDRHNGNSNNIVDEKSVWQVSIPHPHHSGRCFTYKYCNCLEVLILRIPVFSPQFKSTPGECYSIRIGIGDKSKNFSDDYLENLKIFLHEPNEFMYYIEQNDMPNSVKIELKNLR